MSAVVLVGASWWRGDGIFAFLQGPDQQLAVLKAGNHTVLSPSGSQLVFCIGARA